MKQGAEAATKAVASRCIPARPKSPFLYDSFDLQCSTAVHLWTFELSAGVAMRRAGQLLSKVIKGDL